MKFKKIALAISVFVLAIVAHAQPGSVYNATPKLPYVKLYKLNEQQAKYAINTTYKLDTALLFTNMVSQWPYDTFAKMKYNLSSLNYKFITEGDARLMGIKEHGYYVLVTEAYSNGTVQIHIIDYPMFKCKVEKIDNELLLWVSDYEGNMLQNVEVSLNQVKATYVPGMGAYRFNTQSARGEILIKQGETFGYFKLYDFSNVTISRRTAPPKDNYKYVKKYNGYITTNKAVYKRGDTIFWKAFITKPNGKGLKRKLDFVLKAYSPAGYSAAIMGKPVNEKQTKKPSVRGAYNGYFVVADSFPLNTLHYLHAMDKKNELKTYHIDVLDYEKENWELSIWPTKKVYQPEEQPIIKIKSLDKNGLPLLGANIDVVLKLAQFNYAEADSVQFSNHNFDTMLLLHMLADESGETEIKLPKELFIAGVASYNLQATVSNNENHKEVIRTDFKTTALRTGARCTIDNDTLNVAYLYNQKPRPNKFKIQLVNQYDFIIDTLMMSPIALPIDQKIKHVIVTSMDSNFNFYKLLAMPNTQVITWGKRTYDSIFVHLRHPNGKQVFYQLYQNNKLIAEGSDSAWHYQAYDAGKNSYHLRYICFGNQALQAKVQQVSYHFAEKQLTITSKMDKTVFPNKVGEVELTVLKANKKPAKKVNLTAYAVNKQLPKLVAPEVPYLGLYKPQKTMQVLSMSVENCGYNNVNIFLRPWLVEKLELRKNPYFAMQYAKTGIEVLTDTIPDTLTQIQFLVHRGSTFTPIAAVYDNDTLIYSDAYNANSEVQLCSKKELNLKISTNYHTMHLGKVKIIPNRKNFICIQVDSVKNKIQLDPFGPDGEELKAELEKHAFYYYITSPDLYYDTLVIKNNNKLKQAYNQRTVRNFKYMYGKETALDAYGRNYTKNANMQFFIFGPVNENDKIEIAYKKGFGHELKVEPQFNYTFTNRTQNKLIRAQNPILFPVGSLIKDFSTALRFQFLNPYGVKIHKPKSDKPNPIITPTITLNKYQYGNYYPSGYVRYSQNAYKEPQISTLHVQTAQQRLKKLWLFEIKDSSLSIIMNNQNAQRRWDDIDQNEFTLALPTWDNLTHTYVLFMQLHNDTQWIIKKIVINNKHNLYIKLNKLQPISQKTYIEIDRIVKKLEQQPYVPFLDTPTIGGTISINLKPSKNTQLEGLIIGPGMEYPVANAFVILEQGGLFKYGAWSNQQGLFLIDKITPGNYMMKIKAEKYHYWINYNVKIAENKNNLALIKLNLYSNYKTEGTAFRTDGYFEPSGLARHAYAEPSIEGAYTKAGLIVDGMSAIGSGGDENVSYGLNAGKERVKTFKSKPNAAAGRAEMDADGLDDKEEEYEEVALQNAADSIMLDLVDELANNQQANAVRSNFKDYAYWIPNLQTDKNGKVKFAVHYPSDITSWIHYFPAMDNHRNTGLLETSVKSFKPISTNIFTPNYLIEGDVLNTKINIANYTNTLINCPFSYTINNRETIENIALSTYFKKYIELPPAQLGLPTTLQAGIKLSNGYTDAETRTIKTLPATVVSGISYTSQLSNDSTFTIKHNPNDIEHSITIYNNKMQAILDMLNNNSLFIYIDVQTQINYLHTLLIKKQVAQKLGLEDKYSDQIKSILKSVAASQRTDGLICRFDKSEFKDPFLMARIAEVTYLANNLGYNNNTYYNAIKWIAKQVPTASNEEKAAMLYALAKCDKIADYKSLISSHNPKTLTLTGQLRSIYLNNILKPNAPDTQFVLSKISPTPYSDFQIPQYTFYRNWCMPYFIADQNTYLAWEILNQAQAQKNITNLLANNLMRRMQNSSYSAALALQAYYTQFNKVPNPIPTISVNGTQLQPQNFPANYPVTKDLQVQHKLGQATLVGNRVFKTYNPISDSNSYRITSSIAGTHSCSLLSSVIYTVNFMASKNQDFTVVEIPIPAGFKLANKPVFTQPGEVHREYMDNQVVIYLSHCSFGWQTVKLELIATHSGTFHTPPAHIGLLDFADKSAYSPSSTYTITP